jgi:type II secretory ATPase GspE/PulE/Tfp pilus assembly ATPase PilB-like protein
MVGEIRDEETANIAIQSALTGHLVFTTVHANNVVDVLGRFLNMKVEPYNFVSALNCVLAQRLVRKICPSCMEEAFIPDEVFLESNISLDMARTRTLYQGRGCLDCNGTGFRGRMAISELLELSDRVREFILQRKPSSEIKRAAREEGMVTLRESAVKRFLEGSTTLREINKVTFIDEAAK